ncbi:hypothetical protein G3T14_23565 [Methylobacterium sp. BTF04]|uniref:hypothetical protein n=1 Tax=Methylobacterium sp. BTF04 TaxID=2708300 RepID=UPI0013D6E62F|nr:hypothetical protein [Methylobacterium sp. BTF04]NEU15025.1 hypothetical protein [Methylobacterium sp. BTF04]
MNRRSLLAFFGAAPIAVPAIVAAAIKPDVKLSPIDYLEILQDGSHRLVVDAHQFHITSSESLPPLLSFDGYTLKVPSLGLVATPLASAQ